MNIKFIQNAGLGDILFLEPIARKFFMEGHEIYWDTVEIYSNVSRYIPYVHWNEDINSYDKEYNFQFLDMSKFNCRIMEAKYQYADVPFDVWKTFHYDRVIRRERELIKELGLDINKPYRLIHDEYATYQECKIDIWGSANIKNIRIEPIKNFSLFDWSTIIENANEIHAVSTSSLFLFEKLHLINNPDLNLYARENDPELDETAYLTAKDWKFIHYKR